MSEPVLVVDFGTSTSSAALVVGDSVRLVKEPASGSWCWPSSVCLDGENLLVGTAAERLRRVDPLVYRAEFKRDLGDPVPIVLGGKSFRPEDLVTEFIVALRQQAQRLCDQQLHRLVLTVPASYAVADTRRDLMIDAGTAAGFAEVELLTEPVAAAFAPVAGAPIRPGGLVLVYDLGGGTFDAALVRTGEDGQYEVLGHGSLEDVGGRDIDAVLFAHVRELGGDTLAAQLDTVVEDGPRRLAAHRMRTELADFVRQVKHQLSDAPTARDFFSPALLPVLVDRAELTTMVSPPLRRTVRCCAEVLASAGVEPGELTAALLVGGSTQMPVVAETVAAELGVPLRSAEDPSTAVVHGAANWVQRVGLRWAELRVVGPWSCEDGEFPVRWRLPGDTGTIVRWLVEPGDQFDANEPLAVVRVVDGALWRLFASEHPGVLVSRHASVGDRIVSGQWLVTIGSAAPDMKSSSPGSQPATPAMASRTAVWWMSIRGLRRDVAAVKPQIKPLVKKKIPDLAQAMGEAVAKDMTERHVIPVFQTWRNNEIDTVADMVRLVVANVKADLSALNNATIAAVTVEWQNKVRVELDNVTRPVCNRWHIEPGALRLPPITVRTSDDIKVTVGTSTVTENLDNAADAVNVIVAGIVATTLSGAGAALIATGPFAMIINRRALAVGKDKVMGKLQTMKAPRGWERKLISERHILNRLRSNAPKNDADLAAELSKAFTKEFEKSVVEQVTADISAQLDVVADEAELLIK